MTPPLKATGGALPLIRSITKPRPHHTPTPNHAVSFRRPELLWVFVALFGMFEGPMWPAMQSILTEEYSFELQAMHMAGVLCCAKAGIFIVQLIFSFLVSVSPSFPPASFPLTFAAALLARGFSHSSFLLLLFPVSYFFGVASSFSSFFSIPCARQAGRSHCAGE
jgi:MFS family permease